MSVSNVKTSVTKSLRQILRNSAGNATMIVGLAAIPLVSAVGVGVDYARVVREETMLAASIDSALLAIVSDSRSDFTGLSDSEKAERVTVMEEMASNFLADNFRAEGNVDADIEAHLTFDGDTVTMTATHRLPMTFGSFVGVSYIDVVTTSIASREKDTLSPVEIALVMDTTGSMGSTYMNQAKTAARTLLTTLYGGDSTEETEDENIRVSLVPFAAAVRLDKNAYDFDLDWIDTTGSSAVSKLNFSSTSWHNYSAWSQLSGQTWNGCVEARMRGSAPFDYNVNDASPTTGNSLFTPYFAPDEPTFSGSTSSPYNFDNSYINNSGTPRETTGISTSTSSSNWSNRQRNVNKYISKSITSESSSSYGPWYNCAKSAVVPMTYNRSKIEAGITAMSASGNTLIAEGLAWGWRTLSPTEPFTKVEAGPSIDASTISEYGGSWNKVLVLMTDGENNVSGGLNSLNGSVYSAYGYASAATASNRFGVSDPEDAEDALDDAMLELCDNIKAEGVIIYTVAFRVDSETILNNLEACATSEAHYSYAADGTELAEVFSEIGDSVKSMVVRLTK